MLDQKIQLRNILSFIDTDSLLIEVESRGVDINDDLLPLRDIFLDGHKYDPDHKLYSVANASIPGFFKVSFSSFLNLF